MSDQPNPVPERDIFSVSRLVREAKAVLEGSFPLLWVEGEISNLARPASGHIYFTLKDEAAQVRCAMFRMRGIHLGFRPENGQRVMARARVSLYEARGEFQLIIEHMEEAGFGALQRQFEALKNRLGREGLFDADHKKPLPTLPRRIGVITSPSGAAIRDILSVLQRRFPAIPVLIYPVAVQGEGAAGEIAAAIRLADRRRDCDVLIVSRGGGSLEDLWAFNEEVVARAIHECETPIVSGIGHEIDFTIADFVADLRAPTPSAAAELITPDQYELRQSIDQLALRLNTAMRRRLEQAQQRLAWLDQRLQQNRPDAQLARQRQRISELDQRLQRAMAHRLRHARARLDHLDSRLKHRAPLNQLQALQYRNDQLALRLRQAMEQALGARRQRLASLCRALHNISPLATLERGYAILQRHDDQRLVTDAREVAKGDKIEARLARGRLLCNVIDTLEESP